MKLFQLEYFYMINKHGSFRNAAKVIGVSQPAITAAIHKLEEELDVPLFDRNCKNIVLTKVGKIMLRRVTNILSEMQGLQMEVDAVLSNEPETIRLAFCLGEDLPLNVAAEFKAVYPKINVVMEQCNALRIIPALEEDEYDIGVTFTELVTSEQESLLYNKQEYGIFFPKDHRFKDFDVITPQQLKDETLLVPSIENEIEKSILRYCVENHINPQMKKMASGMDSFIASVMVGYGDGIAILPISQINDVDTVSARKLDPPLYMELSIVWSKNKFLNKALKTLIDLLIPRK